MIYPPRPHPFAMPRVGPSIVTRNLLLFSEDLSNNVYWTPVALVGPITTTPNYGIAPNGTMTSTRIQRADQSCWLQQSFFGTVPATHSFTLWLRTNTPANVYTFLGDGVDGVPGYIEALAIGPEWTRYKMINPAHVDYSGLGFAVLIGYPGFTSSLDFEVWGTQISPGTNFPRYNKTIGSYYNPP